MKKLTWKSYSSIERLPEGAEVCFESVPEQAVFLAKDWFSILSKHVFSQDKIDFHVAMDDQAVVAIIPLIWPKASPSNPHSLSNYYSSYYCCLINPMRKTPELLALIAKTWLNFMETNRAWRTLTLTPLAADDQFLQAIINSPSPSIKKETYFQYGNWYTDLHEASFAEYWQLRPSRLKNTWKRKAKKLAKLHPNYTIQIHKSADAFSQHAKAWWRIYALSWKSAEPYPEFIESLCLDQANQGNLRFGVLTIDNQPVAAQIWFIKNKTAYIYKLAYDPAFKAYSVGSVLSYSLFEKAIDHDKVERIDYLTGDDAYKRDWMTTRAERVGLRLTNVKRLDGWLLNQYDTGKSWFKSLFKRSE